jgi:hypothetical protein
MKPAVLGLGLFAASAFGFEAVMKIQPPLISLEESAVLSIEVRDAKKPESPALPNTQGLRFVSAGQTQQSSWINGKSDRFITYNFRVYPQQTGTFAIGPFDYKVDGKIQTLEGELKVVSTSGDARQAQSWADVLFARLETDRDRAYVQEPFGLTLSIYSRQGVQMAGSISLQGMPETGLDGLQWQEIQPERDVINNVIYDIRRFQTRTRAMSSGVFEFNPLVTVQMAVPNQNNRSRSPFDDPFFNPMFQRTETRPVDLSVEKAVITIQPLPEGGKPSGFSGAVGRFDFQVSARPQTVHPGEPVTLTMSVSGDGNFDRVAAPPFPDNEHFRLYGETVRKQADNAVLFEQVISPRTADVTEIPSVPFSFFDTKSGQYRTVQSAPIPLSVTEASNSTAQVFANRETIILPAPDRPFATESDVQRAASWFKRLWNRIRPWLWTLPAGLVLWLTGLFIRKFHLNRRLDAARARRQKAPEAARHALRAATHARKHGDTAAFHNALWGVLAGYFGNRLNLPPGEVTPASTLQALDRAGLKPDLLNTLRMIFAQVESSRYGLSNATSPESMEKLQSSLEQILKQCEKMRL